MTQDHDALQRYSRHLLLPEIGFAGQERIRAKTALIVGMGGLGCPAAMYLASSGVGRLILMDHDQVDLTNLQRQVLYVTEDIGQQKVHAAKRRLQAMNAEVQVEALPIQADENNLPAQMARADVVLDCTDRFATRHLLNRAAIKAKKPLVMASALRFDGQLMVIDPRVADAPCYACLFPEAEGAEDARCALMGVFAPLVGMMGAMQALEALKLLAELPRHDAKLSMVSALDSQIHHIKLSQSPECPYHSTPYSTP